jgi:serine/threonine-protein kinase
MAAYDRSLGELIAGKYRIVGTLGQGGMGSVYEAVNDAVGKRVAVKLLNANLADNPEFGRRFELEARAAALINHPGIVDVLDFGRDTDGSPYIVMEHLQGLTVRALQRAVGPLRAGLATAIIAPALEALAAAHDAGVVHRGRSPQMEVSRWRSRCSMTRSSAPSARTIAAPRPSRCATAGTSRKTWGGAPRARRCFCAR